MVTIISHNETETIDLGERWGREASPGWVFGISGPLGAGKTQLVRGIAKGLALGDCVRSPTFTIVREYTGGKHPLFHLDLFRIETPAQFDSAGLQEYLFSTEGVTAIEWFENWLGTGDAVRPRLPCTRLRRVVIDVVGGNARRITHEDTCA